VLLEVFPVGPIQANCVLLGDQEAGVVAVFDPGEEGRRIADRIAETGLQTKMILHTHGHLDHAGGTAELARIVGSDIPVGLHRDELEMYSTLATQGRMFGLEAENPPQPTLWLEHGQRLELGALTLEVRHTPGHSPGGVSFVVEGAPEPLVIGSAVPTCGGAPSRSSNARSADSSIRCPTARGSSPGTVQIPPSVARRGAIPS